MNKKKIDELNIIRKIYPEPDYEVVKSLENPDFILKDHKSKDIFGVEVTRYYDTSTSGRFKNIPHYSEKLINKKFVHKEDIGILNVIEDMVKIDDDGSEIPLPKGVMRELPQSPVRIRVLQELVAGKNKKFFKYDHSIKNIDLLIYDSGDLIAGLEIQKSQILNYLRKQELANTLVSPFRRIHLVIEEPSGKLIKIMFKSD